MIPWTSRHFRFCVALASVAWAFFFIGAAVGDHLVFLGADPDEQPKMGFALVLCVLAGVAIVAFMSERPARGGRKDAAPAPPPPFSANACQRLKDAALYGQEV